MKIAQLYTKFPVPLTIGGLALLGTLLFSFFRLAMIDEFRSYAAQGDVNGIRAALGFGLHPDVQDEWSGTPLMAAVSNGHYEATKVLLEAGADPLIKDYQGVNALHLTNDKRLWNLLNRYARRRKDSR